MPLSLNIHLVSAQELYPIRQKILRPGLPLESVQFEGDLAQESFHVGAYLNKKLIGAASFVPEKHAELLAKSPFRLRGMAVDSEFQGNGAGKQILFFAESLLQQKNADLLWFNARENAFSFYKKQGYQFWNELFDIPGVGPHKVMYKFL